MGKAAGSRNAVMPETRGMSLAQWVADLRKRNGLPRAGWQPALPGGNHPSTSMQCRVQGQQSPWQA